MGQQDTVFLFEGADYHLAKMEESHWRLVTGHRRDQKVFVWHLSAFIATLRTMWDSLLHDVNIDYGLGLNGTAVSWGAVQTALQQRDQWDEFCCYMRQVTQAEWFQSAFDRQFHPWQQELVGSASGRSTEELLKAQRRLLVECKAIRSRVNEAIRDLYGRDATHRPPQP